MSCECCPPSRTPCRHEGPNRFIEIKERDLEALKLQKNEIAEALVRLQTAISDDVRATGPFKIDLHKVSRGLKDAMMHAVTIIQANGLIPAEKRKCDHDWQYVSGGTPGKNLYRCRICKVEQYAA